MKLLQSSSSLALLALAQRVSSLNVGPDYKYPIEGKLRLRYFTYKLRTQSLTKS